VLSASFLSAVSSESKFLSKKRGNVPGHDKKRKEADLSRTLWSKTRRQRFSFMSSYTVAEIALAETDDQLRGGSSTTAKQKSRQANARALARGTNSAAEKSNAATGTHRSTLAPVMKSTKGLKGK